MSATRPLLLGHRGARSTRTVPENTFPSFDLSLQHGCDGFEFDVRLTADGRQLICHDPHHDRINIAQAGTEKLQQLPTLSALLERYSQRAFLDIELKVSGMGETTLKALRRFPPERGFVLSSFLPQVLRDLHSLTSSLPLGIICDRPEQLDQWITLPVTHVIPHHQLITQQLAAKIHHAGKKLFVWTVNNREAMLRLAEWDADAIISDDTELLVRTLGR